MVKCKKCGKIFDEKYVICPECLTPCTTSDSQTKEMTSKSKHNPIHILITLAIIAIAIVLVIPLFQTESSSYASRGEKYLSEGNYDDAITDLKWAITSEPDNAELYINLADAYLYSDDVWGTSYAIQTLEDGYKKTESTEIKKKLEELQYSNYIETKNYDEAIKLKPNNAEAYIKAGENYIADNDIDSAKSILNTGYEKTKSKEVKELLDSIADIAESGYCGTNTKWTLDKNGLLTISGSGYISDISSIKDKNKVSEIVIQEGITKIGGDEFMDRIDDELVQGSVFSDFDSLTSITIPNSVTSIGYEAFKSCDSLTSITLPESITSIGNHAFQECTNLKDINIPDSVTYIGLGAFEDCTSLTSITIPEGVTSIENTTFYNCTSLTDVKLPDNIKKIGDSAFCLCSNLKNINIPENLISIGACAFYDCNTIKSITIPKSVTTIGSSAFLFWKTSQTIYIKGRKLAPSGWNDCWSYYCDAEIVWNA